MKGQDEQEMMWDRKESNGQKTGLPRFALIFTLWHNCGSQVLWILCWLLDCFKTGFSFNRDSCWFHSPTNELNSSPFLTRTPLLSQLIQLILFRRAWVYSCGRFPQLILETLVVSKRPGPYGIDFGLHVHSHKLAFTPHRACSQRVSSVLGWEKNSTFPSFSGIPFLYLIYVSTEMQLAINT